MKTTRVFTFLPILLFSFVIFCTTACSDDDPVQPQYTIGDFVGTWHAQSSIHTNNTDSNESIDLMDLGGELRFTVLDHGGVRTWVEIDSVFYDEWDSKLIIIDNHTARTEPEETERGISFFQFELDGDNLILTNTDDSFDFTLMGNQPVSSTSVSEFVRY